MRRVGILAGIGGLVLVALGAWLAWKFAGPLPSDASLRSKFAAHRGELDALVAVARADSELVGAAHDPMLLRFIVFVRGTPQADRMLTDREVRVTGRFQYRKLLDRVGLPAISRGSGGATIRFTVASNLEARKGIAYSELPLVPLRAALDGLDRPHNGHVEAAYTALAPHWYEFLESSD